ncbi:MAG: thioredoxin [Candidatus Promineifilaceae bacterium]|nr:thioredoxin [Candidatus Promineifilaceae bacterium]
MDKLEFQQKMWATNKPVLIDFWATWCGPCQITKPILEKLAEEYGDKVEFMPVNVDDSREVLEQFRVLAIPTIITMRNGKEVGRVSGAQSEENYRAMFQALVEGKDVQLPVVQFDRMLRLGAGALFLVVGFVTQSWIVAGVGGLIAFMGVYDRCPLLRMVTGMFRRS